MKIIGAIDFAPQELVGRQVLGGRPGEGTELSGVSEWVGWEWE